MTKMNIWNIYYQVLMMGEGWGKKCSASYVTGREDMFILVESITISLMN